MTRDQMDALQSYVSSTVRVMAQQGDHSSNVRLYLASKAVLEVAFGVDLPEQPAPQPILPNLL